MNYQTRLNEHLSLYKKNTLEIAEPGLFSHRGRLLAYDHILPLERKWNNLLEPARSLAQARMAAKQDFKLHRYFHHLNSSQAFAFNLFFPYFEFGAEASGALLRALGQQGSVTTWQPEAIPDQAEGTNIDVWWQSSQRLRTFCEVKLSESEFGTAPAEGRGESLDTRYRPALQGHVDPALLEETAFFAHYQLLRNVWHVVNGEDKRLVLLLPRANRKIWDTASAFLPKLGQPLRDRVSVVAVEDALGRLAQDNAVPPLLRGYAQELQKKYLVE